MNLGHIIHKHAQERPDEVAIVYDGRSVTFAGYNAHVNRLISAFDAFGVGAGERVAILSKNNAAYLKVYGACEKGGRIAVPMNWRLAASEAAFLLNDSGARILFFEEEFWPAVESIRHEAPSMEQLVCIDGDLPGCHGYTELIANHADREPPVSPSDDDIAWIMYTSGTTGRPKGAMLTHGAQWARTSFIIDLLQYTERDATLHVMPFFHIGGRVFSLNHFVAGGKNVILRRFDARRTLELIERERVTTLHIVPTMLALLLDEPDYDEFDLGTLRLVLYAGGPMPVELLRRAITKMGPIFCQGFGQTESGPTITQLLPHEHVLDGDPALVARLGSCGKAVAGVQVRLVDDQDRDVPLGTVGEAIVKSDFIMRGYWNNPEETAKVLRGGWLRTGDMLRQDADGYYYVVDRKKDMIISGGENIYAREVEETIYGHPAVQEAAVIGVPDEKWGEAVKACVVLRNGSAPPSEDDLVNYCRERLARFKAPKSVDFLTSLPKNASGKILKRDLRQAYSAARTRQA